MRLTRSATCAAEGGACIHTGGASRRGAPPPPPLPALARPSTRSEVRTRMSVGSDALQYGYDDRGATEQFRTSTTLQAETRLRAA